MIQFTIKAVLLSASMAFCQSVFAQNYSDDSDIATYRPRFKPTNQESVAEPKAAVSKKKFSEPKLDVTKSLNVALDSVYVKNKQIKFAQGYRVLVYAGTDKVLMNQIKQKVYKAFPDIALYTVFKQPEYRISFGDFIDKIQANNYLTKILPVISNALIVQEQIPFEALIK